MSTAAARFEREEIQAAEALALTFELKDAGSWHAARCTGPGARVCGFCADNPDEDEGSTCKRCARLLAPGAACVCGGPR